METIEWAQAYVALGALTLVAVSSMRWDARIWLAASLFWPMAWLAGLMRLIRAIPEMFKMILND